MLQSLGPLPLLAGHVAMLRLFLLSMSMTKDMDSLCDGSHGLAIDVDLTPRSPNHRPTMV